MTINLLSFTDVPPVRHFEIVVLPIRWKIVRKGRYFVDLVPLMKVNDDRESPEYRKQAMQTKIFRCLRESVRME